ncbi:MAG: aspartate 1-decarboxylase [Spartobacteria bacterium]|nr:aspartate 1-decarboxylase [Spartobacteria bacterium]
MQRTMLKSKIHLATLTGLKLDYEGSIAIDEDLLDMADMLPGEQCHVLNANNGTRLVTYVIPAERGSRTFMLNGPAARLGVPGDKVVIITYASMNEAELAAYAPRVLLMDENNDPRKKV